MSFEVGGGSKACGNWPFAITVTPVEVREHGEKRMIKDASSFKNIYTHLGKPVGSREVPGRGHC
jgi:hypothetical protein